MWEQRSVQYVTILNRIGFNAEPKAFQDLTGIMDPLRQGMWISQHAQPDFTQR